MTYVKKLIPFCVWPANWGLTGPAKKQAQAAYNYEGKELKIKMAEIDREFFGDFKRYMKRLAEIDYEYGDIDEYTYRVAILAIDNEYNYPDQTANFDELDKFEFQYAKIDLDLEFNKIDERQYDEKLTDLEFPDKESDAYKHRLVDIDLKYGVINEKEAAKQKATIDKTGWVDILNADFLNNPTLGSGINFELDWNDYFIDELIDNGFSGVTPEDIINQWFTEMCAETFDEHRTELEGTTPTNARAAALGMKTTIHKIGDGKVEIS